MFGQPLVAMAIGVLATGSCAPRLSYMTSLPLRATAITTPGSRPSAISFLK